MEAGFKLWVKNEQGEKAFGHGPYRLLKLVEETGSLNKSAEAMGMSYSKALAIIKKAEETLTLKLLERAIGGAKGGGSHVTKEAKEYMKRYEKYEKLAADAIEQSYQKAFGEGE